MALGAAAAWGSGDFSGGLAGRRSHIAVVVTWSACSGAVLTAAALLVSGVRLPDVATVGWAASAGIAGALGLAALFRGLAVGRSALVAPIAGVTGAAIPVIVGLVTEGALPVGQETGLVVALVGIWLLTQQRSSSADTAGRRGMGLAVMAGIGFGGFFVLFAQVESGAVLPALAINRVAALAVGLMFVVITRAHFTGLGANRLALVAGVMDATGGLCYLLATGFVRAEVAAVLGSFYPAVTVVLYRALGNERIVWTQWLGIVFCVAATAMIVGM